MALQFNDCRRGPADAGGAGGASATDYAVKAAARALGTNTVDEAAETRARKEVDTPASPPEAVAY